MRSGLRKVVRSVKGKHGPVRRSYWVKTQKVAKRVGRALWNAKGTIAVTAGTFALVGLGLHAHDTRKYNKRQAADAAFWAQQRDQASKHQARMTWFEPKSVYRHESQDKWAARVNGHRQEASDTAGAFSDFMRHSKHVTNEAPLQLASGPLRNRPESAGERFTRMKKQNFDNWNKRHKNDRR